MIDKYDLIFLGIDIEDSKRDEAIRDIARLLAIKEDHLKQVIDSKSSVIVKSGLPKQIIQKYQKDISDLGGICNHRYSFNFKDASLEDTYENSVFSCPACYFQEIFADTVDMPEQCPQCGVIPSKYENIEAVKEEKKRVENLMHMYKVCQRQLQAFLDKPSEEKPYTPPRWLNSQRKLIGAAVLVGAFGA